MDICIFGRRITRMVYVLKRFLWVTRATGARKKGYRGTCVKFFPRAK
jgi:hypothetical protein